MKIRKCILCVAIATLVLSQTSLSFAATETTRDENHKFYGGYNTDYGPQVWSITTELEVEYNTSNSSKNLTRYRIFAGGSPHAGISEGDYGFPNGIKTYSGSSKIGTDYRNSFSPYSLMYDPTITYPYMHGEKYVSYSIPASKTAAVKVDCVFSVGGWTPIVGTSWKNTVSVSI